MHEQALCFTAQNKTLLGIVHHAQSSVDIGVLVVVGGPQTRVGSHRQFVLLSRYLAENSIPSMRFDYTGMGDSDGDVANYLDVTADIESAIDAFKQAANVQQVVIWGLCDAVSAALLFARRTIRTDIAGYIFLNPWTRSVQGEAKTVVKHYYLNRLKDKTFWKKLFSFEFNPFQAFTDLAQNLKKMSGNTQQSSNNAIVHQQATTEDNYIEHMLIGLQRLTVPVLLVISGKDLTAAEFLEVVKSSKSWQIAVAAKVTQRIDIEEADHTFSSEVLRAKVETATLQWIKEL